jgi:hypothetical protein
MDTENASSRSWSRPAGWGLPVLVFILGALATASLIYTVREHRQNRDLAATNQALSATLGQVQNQLQTLSEKLNTLAVAPPAATQAEAAPVARPRASVRTPRKAVSHRVAARRRPVDDPRWNQIRSQLTDQQKELANTREQVEKTRSDLEGRLSSTKDELNGSIARTHEELVALEKRGQRNYYEFSLDKTKRFQRVGPVSVSLRKVNFKRKSYNLALMVDDFELNKKNVNLYEPVWLTLTDRPQPLELVVNRISKDHIQGYLSEPKFKKSELAATTKPAADKTQEVSTPR